MEIEYSPNPSNALSENSFSSQKQKLSPQSMDTLQIADLATVWHAHNQLVTSEEGRYRKFDPAVPYAAHPTWCAMAIWCEPGLPAELRHPGAIALQYHDFKEDTTAEIPGHLSPKIIQYIDDMTYPGGSEEERSKIWTKSPEIRLFKLYDRVSNMMDACWMDENKRATHFRYLDQLNQDVKRNYPGLNITAFADGLLEKYHLEGLAPEDRIYVSVANLVPRVRCGDQVYPIAILNRKQFEKGNRVFSALGGAAELTAEGALGLKALFSAELNEGQDARFTIKAKHLEGIIRLFTDRNSALYETNPERELSEELGKTELAGISAVLDASAAQNLSYNYLGSYRQPPPQNGTSARSTDGSTARRFFNLFELNVTHAQLETFHQHPAIRFLSKEELQSTNGGTSKGKTSDGDLIADNIFAF